MQTGHKMSLLVNAYLPSKETYSTIHSVAVNTTHIDCCNEIKIIRNTQFKELTRWSNQSHHLL